MTEISSRNIRHFLAAASLALAIPLAVAAPPGVAAGAHDECDMMHGHGEHAMHHDMGGEFSPHHLHALNLTEVQHDKVFEIMHAQAPAMRDKAKKLRHLEDDLRKLGLSPDYSEAKARALADEVGKATFEMTLARAQADRQIYEVLTPEQRQQLAEMKAGRHLPGPGKMPRDGAAAPMRR